MSKATEDYCEPEQAGRAGDRRQNPSQAGRSRAASASPTPRFSNWRSPRLPAEGTTLRLVLHQFGIHQMTMGRFRSVGDHRRRPRRGFWRDGRRGGRSSGPRLANVRINSKQRSSSQFLAITPAAQRRQARDRRSAGPAAQATDHDGHAGARRRASPRHPYPPARRILETGRARRAGDTVGLSARFPRALREIVWPWLAGWSRTTIRCRRG